MIDPHTLKTLKVNKSLCSILGYPLGEMIGKSILSFAGTANQQTLREQASLIGASSHQSFEVSLKAKNGKNIPVHITTTTLYDPVSNGITSVFSIIRDLSEQKRYEAELYHQANYDTITGLANRHFLIKHLDAKNQAGESLSILLLHLDNFKIINNTLGHTTGDHLLIAVAKRLESALPAEHCFISRAGSADFAVVVRSATNATELLKQHEVHQLALGLLDVFTEPINVDAAEVTIAVTIGIAISPTGDVPPNRLLENANLALCDAKKRGGNCIRFYTDDMGTQLRRKMDITTQLRGALDRNEFQLQYQPQCLASTGSIIGVEALLRWNNNDERISPTEFIPVLEETGLIIPVGKWVLETACRQAVSWHRAGHPLRISINISARQLRGGALDASLRKALRDNPDLPPTCVRLELTESLLIDSVGHTAQLIKKMTETGVTFSIDDFGTGYSSLSYIHQLPIREVKIDRMFVNRLLHDKNSINLVKTIVAMAQSFEAETVAEGIETKEQYEILAEIGVDIVQGNLFGHPVPPEELTPSLSMLRGENEPSNPENYHEDTLQTGCC
jgi:diguanylate cyclase (GGDEF)-like protein/PAS domain S-box-containing protein